uniref:Olfactory receptor C family, v1 n=1 Tax=Oncorhynchus kisutch TaxID=8019 RepID=A0A8C7MXR8_ONCKI
SLTMSLLLWWSLYYPVSISPLTEATSTQPACSPQGAFELPGFSAQGDFLMGGIFPLHYRVELPGTDYTHQPLATMRLAVEEINQSEQLLPNHTLGYKIFDSCATPVTALRAVLAVLNGHSEEQSPMCSGASPLIAMVGESGSSQSIVLSRTLQCSMFFQISYFSTCSCLSDRQEYPTFFRVVPNDDYQVKAIASLLQRFGWKWIGVIREDHDYGHFALQGLKREIQNTDVCLAYDEMIPKDYSRERVLQILEVMRHSTARVVIVFSGEGELYPFLKEFVKQNITGTQWVASEAWVTANVLAETYPFLDGTIGFAIRSGKVPGLRDYLQTVNPRSTLMPPCSGQETLLEQHSAYMNTSSPRVAYNVYKAVYAIAHSLHNLLHCQAGAGPFHNRSCAHSTNVHPWQLQQYLQDVSFNVSGENMNFDQKGDAIPSYDLINWQRGPNGGPRFLVVSVCSASCAPGSRKAVRRGEPLCCFDCVPCDSGKISNQTDSIDCHECPEDYWSNADGTMCIPKVVEFLSHDAMGIALTVIAVVGACLTVSILAVFLHHRTTPIVRVNNSELSFFILLSLTLCFLCALMFIGEPTSWSCMLRHTAFSITFSLCISCILGKTLVVLAAFTAARPGNNIMKWLGPKQQRVIIFSCTLVQVLICAAWLMASPPYPSKNIQDQRSKIILECSVGSQLAFWCVLGYIGLLACLCFILAFLARKLPGNFNEAKFITFSMLIFCAVWISFIPAYVSSPGKYTVAVEIFAILASSFGLLFCLFAPKCYIILLKNKMHRLMKTHLFVKVLSLLLTYSKPRNEIDVYSVFGTCGKLQIVLF